MDLENNFLEWLKLNKNLSEKSSNNYVGAVRTIGRFLSEELGSKVNIFEISDKNDFNQIIELIENSKKTLERYNTGNRMYSRGMKHYGEFLQFRATENEKMYHAEDLSEHEVKYIEGDTWNKKIIISKFTKDLLQEKGFLLDHSDNTRIRFSTERLDSIVGFIGEGWSKQIKRLLLFEIENGEDKYTLKLIIGPGNQEVREALYLKAKENIELYHSAKNSLTPTYTTIYSKKILNREQLSSYSLEQLKNYIIARLEEFIESDLTLLCEGLRFQDQIELENELLDLMDDDILNTIEETEKLRYVKARIGHSKLKEILVKKEKCCKICGLSDTRFLIASHIKPWSKSTRDQRLDLNNVLLLCPHHDSVFDKGYITFDQNGLMMISSELNLETRALLNLNPERKVELTDKQTEYILWHRENVFHT